MNISFAFHERLLRARSRSTQSFVSKAREYVRNNYSDEDLSWTVSVNSWEFPILIFLPSSVETGSTFIGYLTDYRMERASRLLIETNEEELYHSKACKATVIPIISAMYLSGNSGYRLPNTGRSMEQVKHKMIERLKRVNPKGMQTTIMIAFTVISTAIMLILGTVMYVAFSVFFPAGSDPEQPESMEQTGEKLEDYLLSMRQISDAVYYNVIKESDFASQDKNIQRGMNLLYEANRDKLRNIAVYNNYGSLMAAEPVAAQKENPDVTRQEWYQQAMDEVENMHFSVPHIQNLFEDAAFRYHWVVSLSRAVEICTENGVPRVWHPSGGYGLSTAFPG